MSTITPPSSQVKTPALSDIQKLVTRGYTFHFSRHIILTVQDPARAREFLRQLHKDEWLVDAHEDRDKVNQRFESEPHPAAHSLIRRGVVAARCWRLSHLAKHLPSSHQTRSSSRMCGPMGTALVAAWSLGSGADPSAVAGLRSSTSLSSTRRWATPIRAS